MTRVSIILLILTAALAVSPAARASSDSFNFTFTDGAVSGSGTLYGTLESSGAWLITSGSGVFNDGVNSGAIALIPNSYGAGLSNSSPLGYFGYDDLLFLWAGPGQLLDENGLFFSFQGMELNIWQGGNGLGKGGWAESNGSGDLNGSFTISSYTLQQAPMTVSGTAITVTAGSTNANTSSITVSPAGGFTGSVALSAAITSSPAGAQYPPVLSFGSTNPVSITGTASGTATLTITTTAATNSALNHPIHRNGSWYGTGAVTLAIILVFGIPARQRKWRTMLGMLVILVGLLAGVQACGGSSASGGGGKKISGTTAGDYIVTITGASGLATATSTVTLTVQ